VVILLDSGPLGLLANPSREGPARMAREWAEARLEAGDHLTVSEIADYEVRRELLRADRAFGLERLDELCAGFDYEPLTTPIMRSAAALWADARNVGAPTAHDNALDGDVILAAQARHVAERGVPVLVATTNVKHLKRYVDARVWSEI
jgi:predicted nucleic acid-binding protein